MSHEGKGKISSGTQKIIDDEIKRLLKVRVRERLIT